MIRPGRTYWTPLVLATFVQCFLLSTSSDLSAQAINLNEPQTRALIDNASRGFNICGTQAGQTPFTIDAHLLTSYNGYGVSCPGLCNGRVEVTRTGGIGPFTFQWVGGPNTAIWNNVCAANQIVLVRDLGQNITCAVTVDVTDPPQLTVVFSDPQAPTCSSVCNGSANVFAVGGVFSYTYNWNNGSEFGQFPTQLCVGTNTLLVTDANNCTFDTTFVLSTDPVHANEIVTDVSCFGVCDGSVITAVTGGTPPYTYNWSPVPTNGNNTPVATGLCAGPISVTIGDANGCDTTLMLMIDSPLAIDANLASTNASCATSCNGAAMVNPNSGVGSFSYDWEPGSPNGDGTASVTDLCGGNWSVTITDNSSGCDTTVAFVITAPPPVDPMPTVTNGTCSGACDGSIVFNPTGGTPPYTYLWNPVPPIGGTSSGSGLCAGDWTITVTGSAGCDSTVVITITEPDPILPNETSTDATCAGECDGTITLAPSGGTPPYDFSWSPVPPNGDGTAAGTGLCAGTWMITISDVNDCDTTVSITIAEPPPLMVNATQVDASCNGECNGSISLSVSGGTPGYIYQWTPTPPIGDGTDQVSGLCAGPWSVLITDLNGCELDQQFTIGQPALLNVVITPTDATCGNSCDGSAMAQVMGGTPPYVLFWDPAPVSGQGTLQAVGLCPGSNSLTVTDGQNCDTTITFQIGPATGILPNELVTPATCADLCDGAVVLAPTGGIPPFTFLWTPAPNGGPNVSSANDLCPGTYSIQITDNAGCDTVLSIDISSPPAIDVLIASTDVLCAGDCNGTIDLTINGGTPPLTVLWTPMPPNGQNTPNVSGLCAGTWQALVSDATGCDTLIVVDIIGPDPIDPGLTLSQPTCGGGCDGMAGVNPSGGTAPYTITWNPIPPDGQGVPSSNQLCPGTWMITVSDANGCDSVSTFVLSAPTAPQVSTTVANATCVGLCDGEIQLTVSGGVAPINYSWSPTPPVGDGTDHVEGLCPGDWTVTVSDASGCDTTLVINVGASGPIIPNGTATDETCNGPCDGTITLNPAGGQGPYQVSWTPAPPSGSGLSISGLCAGPWTAQISDANGCDTTITVMINATQPIIDNFSGVDASCPGLCNGEAMVNPTGGVPPYSYVWSPTPAVGQGTNMVSGLCFGGYTVVITDSVGCSVSRSFIIQKPSPIVPNLSVLNENCTASCTGSASAAPFGAFGGPYTFNWSPLPAGNQQGNDSIVNLCAGTTYSLTIADVMGCDTTVTFQVGTFIPFQAIMVTTPSRCVGQCNGTSMLTTTGGQPPYSYTWTPTPPNNQQGNSSITELCAGNYSVLIDDQNGCDTTIFFIITEPTAITVSANVLDASCNGTCDGEITVTPSGGTQPYNYVWSPGPPIGQNTNSISGLCAGSWTMFLTDANGCDTAITYLVGQPAPIMITPTVSPSHCQVCDGSVVVNVTGGTQNYTYAWTDQNGVGVGNSDSVIDLCAGIYTLTVTDAQNCVKTLVVPISDADGEILTTTNGVAACSNSCDGELTVNFTCSDPACSVTWYDAAGAPIGQTGNTATGLCIGEYIVGVMNASGCLVFDTAMVSGPAALVPVLTTTQISCTGDCNGTASVTVNGGVPPFTYFWDPAPPAGQGTSIVTGLCAGTYTLTVTDVTLCDSTVSFTIIEPDQLDPDGDVVNASCVDDCDGEIVLNPSGGTAPYQIFWDPVPPNGDGTIEAFDLCVGDYTVTLFDANGCTAMVTYTVGSNPPVVLVGSSVDSHCQVCDGSASVMVTSGSPPFFYTWTDVNSTTIATDTNTVYDLCAGIYVVHVSDQQNCDATLVVPVSDADGEVITATGVPASCVNGCDGSVSATFNCLVPPCTTTWYDGVGTLIAQNVNSVNNLCVGMYVVGVQNAAGCLSFDTTQVVQGDQIIPNLSTVHVSCANACDGTATANPTGGIGPYDIDWSPQPGGGQGTITATGLCAGNYSVSITDMTTGCSIVQPFLILQPTLINVNAAVTNVQCGGECTGSIVLNTAGGTGSHNYSWSPVPPNGPNTAQATGLCAGPWTVTVTDQSGCDTSITYVILEPPPVVLNTSATTSSCSICDGSAVVTPSGGSQPYQYAWTGPSGPIGADSLITDLCAGIYSVTVTDAIGCTSMATVIVSDQNGEVLMTMGGITSCPDTCDGTVSVAFTCSDPPCAVSWSDVTGTSIGQDTATATGLCPGMYIVTVMNASGCTSIDTASVVGAPPIVPNLSTVPVACGGQCTGSATINPTGGIGPYAIFWDPEPAVGQGTSTASGLCAGNYTVTITDSTAGCSLVQGFVILQPMPFNITPAVSHVQCGGQCTGSVVLNVTGGSGNPTYSWSPAPPNGNNSAQALDLCAGMWTVTISDQAGCDTSITYTILEPATISLNTSSTQSHCLVCDGTATVTPTGGVDPYQYAWTGPNGNAGSDSIATGLCAGIYSVNVIDATGCSIMSTVIVSDAIGEVLTTNDGFTSCPDTCDGSVNVAFTCSDPPCLVSWSDATGSSIGQDTTTATGLCAGMYFVSVINASGCTAIDTAMVIGASPILPNLATTVIACNDSCTATATVNPTGGAGGYQYFWSPQPPAGQGTQSVSGLCPGNYTVLITDLNLCDTLVSFTIDEPQRLDPNAVVTNAMCSGNCDGSIVLSPQGGTGPYTYLWNPPPPNGQGDSLATGLCAMDWTVTVTDVNGCDSTVTYTIIQQAPILINVATTDNVCYGECMGAAFAVFTGGAPPYTIVWQNVNGTVIATDTNMVDGLCAGDYEFIITDSTGCSATSPFTILNGPIIEANLSFTNESCLGPCDGTATINPTGGSGPITILWTPMPPVGQGTTQISGLCAGQWCVTLTDSLNCDTTYCMSILPYTGIAPNSVVDSITCNAFCDGSITLNPSGGIGPYSYMWDPPVTNPTPNSGTGLCAGPMNVTVTDGLGCDTVFTFNLNEPPLLVVTVDQVVDATCSSSNDGSIDITVSGGVPGYSITWNGPNAFVSGDEDISQLLPGVYNIQVIDAHNCQIDVPVTVSPLTILIADAGPDTIICPEGSAVPSAANSIGGNSLVWTDLQGNLLGMDTIVDLSGYSPGTYQIILTVSDGAQCVDTDTVSVNVLSSPTIDAGDDQSIFLNEVAQLGGSPTGPPGSSYLWQPDSLLDAPFSDSPIADPIQTTWFTVYVTGPNGCMASDSVLITVIPDLVIPSGFSPNGDGINDTWVIDLIELFPNVDVQIYNRWGEMLFESVGYKDPWNGRYEGEPVPVGTYYYVIDLHDPEYPDAYTGPLTVLR